MQIDLTEIDPEIHIECCNRNSAVQICVNQSCQKHVFTCFGENCKCQENHQGCLKFSIKTAVQTMKQEILDQIEKAQTCIEKMFDQLIDEISQTREKILKQVEKCIRKSKTEYDFLEIIENQQQQTQKFKQYKWDKLKQRLNELNQPIPQILNLIEPIFGDHWKLTRISLQHTFSIMEQKLEHQLMKKSSYSGVQKHFQSNSNIFFTQEQARQLLSYFPKKVTAMNLLYRASKNHFSVPEFIKRAGNQTHVMFLCKSYRNEVFGGYSPISHKWKPKQQLPNKDEEFVCDESNTSFLFSITTNQKFKLLDKKGLYSDTRTDL